MAKRSEYKGKLSEKQIAAIEDPHYVADFPTNEERLRHLDFYTRKDAFAPTVGGGKRGKQNLPKDPVWAEEHEVALEDFHYHEGGIRKVGI